MTTVRIVIYRHYLLFFFKQKTAYEMRISDLSSDVCSSDLRERQARDLAQGLLFVALRRPADDRLYRGRPEKRQTLPRLDQLPRQPYPGAGARQRHRALFGDVPGRLDGAPRSAGEARGGARQDRKSTRLNSSH